MTVGARTAPDRWLVQTVNLSAYAGMQGVEIRIVGISDYENNMYLDNINVLGIVGVENELPQSAVQVYPNPGRDHYHLEINLPYSSEVDIRVTNAFGQEVWRAHRDDLIQEKIPVDLSGMAPGVYFIRVGSELGSSTKKLLHL